MDSFIDEEFTSQIEWLKGLVELPSDTDSREDVEVAAAYVDEAMTELGFEVERRRDSTGERADHRIYSSGSTSAQDEALALVGHVDTVYPQHWDWREDGHGRIYGPGIMDMKGGLSAIVFSLRALRESHPDAYERLKVRFVLNTDEEKGSTSSRVIFQELASRMKCALVFEPGRAEDKIVTTRKGAAPFSISAEVPSGLPAHAGGKHREGSNALHALMLLGHRIESMTDYDRGLTFSVVIDQSDEKNLTMKRNILPSRASFLVDCRYQNPGDAGAAIELLRKEIENGQLPGLADMNPGLNERVARVRLEIRFGGEEGVGRPPMNPTEGIQDLRRRYERHAGACGLEIGEAPLQGGVSDANYIADYGVPVIDGLGPYGENAHRRGDEWMGIDSLSRRTKALARFLFEEADLN